jgi:hypothetical protein
MHIFPLMNPDGGELTREGDRLGSTGRNNSNNIDLSRDFPDLCNATARDERRHSTVLKEYLCSRWRHVYWRLSG